MNGERLKELRRQKGMTQRQVAIECDITQETIKLLESGRNTNPTLATVRKLADCYGVGIAELVD